MSPGPLTSRQHGGHGFGPRFHGHGYGRITSSISTRLVPAPRQTQLGPPPGCHGKFSVETTDDGAVVITPGDDERIVGVGVEVEPVVGEPETSNGGNGNGEGTSRRGRGGFGRDRIAPAYGTRDYARTSGLPGSRQRFSVGGDGKITLDSGEQLVVAVDESGAVTIGVGNSEPANGPGAPGTASRAGAVPGMRRKMSLYAGNDGEVVIRPEDDNTLQVIGDPDSGAVAVIELEPAPPVSPNGNGETGE